VLLSIYNPNPRPAIATVYVGGARGRTVRSRVAGGSSQELSLSLAAGRSAFEGLTLTSTQDVMPQRYVVSGRRATAANGIAY
jgi:hypothetical protein